jgi:hypothetical protein
MVIAALGLGLGGTACGGSPPPPQAPPTASPPTTATATQTTPASPAPTSLPATAGIPLYQPSTVVSQAAGSTVLHTPDPVAKVEDFYEEAIERGGWQVVSKSSTDYSANYVVRKAGQGATISVAQTPGAGPAIVISISTYPA